MLCFVLIRSVLVIGSVVLSGPLQGQTAVSARQANLWHDDITSYVKFIAPSLVFNTSTFSLVIKSHSYQQTHSSDSTPSDSQFGNSLGHSARSSMNAKTQRLMIPCTAVAIEIAWKMNGERRRISSMSIHRLGFRVKHTIVNNSVFLISLPQQPVNSGLVACRQNMGSLLPVRMLENVNYMCDKVNSKIWHGNTDRLLFPSLCAGGCVPYVPQLAGKQTGRRGRWRTQNDLPFSQNHVTPEGWLSFLPLGIQWLSSTFAMLRVNQLPGENKRQSKEEGGDWGTTPHGAHLST